MALTDDIRRTLTDPTPLYFAAGVLDKIREEAPERLAAVRATDPKELQAKAGTVLDGVDADIRKLRLQAQQYALQGLGIASQYADKARTAYGEFADRGRGAVLTRRGGPGKAATD